MKVLKKETTSNLVLVFCSGPNQPVLVADKFTNTFFDYLKVQEKNKGYLEFPKIVTSF